VNGAIIVGEIPIIIIRRLLLYNKEWCGGVVGGV